jgi:hypothetical protein
MTMACCDDQRVNVSLRQLATGEGRHFLDAWQTCLSTVASYSHKTVGKSSNMHHAGFACGRQHLPRSETLHY